MTGPDALDDATLARLREAAEAATGCGMVEDCSDPDHYWYRYSELAARFDDARKAHEDAEFIAAADPPTVTALVAEVERLRAAVGRVEAVADNYQVRTISFPGQRAQWSDIERDLRDALRAPEAGPDETSRGGSGHQTPSEGAS